MARQGVASMFFALALLLGAFVSIPQKAEAIGVCYGMSANNLPPASSVVGMYRSNGITSMRLYAPDQAALQSVGGTGISVVVGAPNDVLSNLAASPAAAASWVRNNIQAYPSVSFRYVAVGNDRGGRGRDVEPGPGDGERPRRAGLRGAGPHQGDHVGVPGAARRVQPALRRRVHRRVPGVHGPRPQLPRPHRRAAARQHLPLLLLHLQPGQRRRQLRPLHRPRHRRPGRRLRLPEPVRHHRRRLLHRHGQARRLRRHPRRLRDWLALRRRHVRLPRQRPHLQPEPHQPRLPRHAAPPRRHRDLRLLHVQREPEGRRRRAELGPLLPQHAARLPHQLLIPYTVRS
uniref:Glucan endo-1,3-beta-D-glucosidase n=1 Tax=Oryza brachyantha TaxID=4533 RepID=J3M6K7_ORYBR